MFNSKNPIRIENTERSDEKKNTQNSEFLYDNSLCTRSSEFGEKNNGKTQVHRWSNDESTEKFANDILYEFTMPKTSMPSCCRSFLINSELKHWFEYVHEW